MIKSYICPICNGRQRIIVDPKTDKPLKTTRCAYNGCPSNNCTISSTSNEYIDNVCTKYRKLVGTHHKLGADGTGMTGEVVVDIQYDGSVIMVDRAEYLPIRLTAEQFDVYEVYAKKLEAINHPCD